MLWLNFQQILVFCKSIINFVQFVVQNTYFTTCGGIIAVFCCGVLLSDVSKVPSFPFFLGGFFMGVFFGVGSSGSPVLEPFKSCFSGLLASGVPRLVFTGATIFCRLLEVGSWGLVEPCSIWLNPVEPVLLAFCGGVGFSRFALGVERPLVFVSPVPSFLLMLWVFSLSWAASSVAASEFIWGWMTFGLLGGSLGVCFELSTLFFSGEEQWKLLIFLRALWTTPLMCSMWLGLPCSSPDFLPRRGLCFLGEPLASASCPSCIFCRSWCFSFILCHSSLLDEPSLELLFFSFDTASALIPPCCSGWGDPVVFPCIHDTLGLVDGSGGRGLGLPGEGGGFPLRLASNIGVPSLSLPLFSSSFDCLERRATKAYCGSLPSVLVTLVSFREVYSPASSSSGTASGFSAAGLGLRLSLMESVDHWQIKRCYSKMVFVYFNPDYTCCCSITLLDMITTLTACLLLFNYSENNWVNNWVNSATWWSYSKSIFGKRPTSKRNRLKLAKASFAIS